MFLSLLFENPAHYWTVLISIVVSVTIHELAHGVAAIRQGDDTPIRLGHMTWNPVVHMGVFSLVILALFGMAWGMMPVNPSRFRGRHGRAWVAFAGPLSNLLLGWVAATALVLIPWLPHSVIGVLITFSVINVGLFLFNLVPIPPLDGATVLGHFDPSFRALCSRPDLQPFFLFLLIGLILVMSRLGLDFFRIGGDAVSVYIEFLSRLFW